jgi:SulP family sulfate permease
VQRVQIDLTHSHLWDATSVGAIDKAVLKLRENGSEVEPVGLNEASATIIELFAVHDKEGDLQGTTLH